MSKQDSSR